MFKMYAFQTVLLEHFVWQSSEGTYTHEGSNKSTTTSTSLVQLTIQVTRFPPRTPRRWEYQITFMPFRFIIIILVLFMKDIDELANCNGKAVF